MTRNPCMQIRDSRSNFFLSQRSKLLSFHGPLLLDKPFLLNSFPVLFLQKLRWEKYISSISHISSFFLKKKRKEKRKIHSSQIFKSVDRSLFSRIPNTEKSRIQKLRFIRFSIVFLATKQKMSNSEDDFESKTEPRIRDIRISSCRR